MLRNRTPVTAFTGFKLTTITYVVVGQERRPDTVGVGQHSGAGSMAHLINCSYGNEMMLSNRVIWHVPLQPQRLHHKGLPLTAGKEVGQAVGGTSRWAGQVEVGCR